MPDKPQQKPQQKPQWWNSAHDLSWSKVKAALIEDWRKVSKEADRLGKELQERAIAFGHGARDAYARFTSWSSELESKLKADWEKTQHAADETWDKVREAVKHGWEKTHRPEKS